MHHSIVLIVRAYLQFHPQAEVEANARKQSQLESRAQAERKAAAALAAANDPDHPSFWMKRAAAAGAFGSAKQAPPEVCKICGQRRIDF
jgi:hypothetical protein